MEEVDCFGDSVIDEGSTSDEGWAGGGVGVTSAAGWLHSSMTGSWEDS